jgi:sulfur relay protein TusB/DsrH
MLHLIQKSPFQTQCLAECLKIASADDVFLLMLDGIYALQNNEFISHFKNILILEPDLNARGLSLNESIHKHIKTINYSDFVIATESHDKVISWY